MPCISQFFQTWGSMITTLALLATLGVIIWYSCETRRLRKETVRQTELQLTPHLILDYKEDLVCKNVGNSTALNVAVSTLIVSDDTTGDLVFEVTFSPLYLLEAKEEKKVNYSARFEDKELEEIVNALLNQGRKFFPFFPEETKKEEFSLTIDYKNLENVPFKTEVSVKCREEKIEILSIKRQKNRDEPES